MWPGSERGFVYVTIAISAGLAGDLNAKWSDRLRLRFFAVPDVGSPSSWSDANAALPTSRTANAKLIFRFIVAPLFVLARMDRDASPDCPRCLRGLRESGSPSRAHAQYERGAISVRSSCDRRFARRGDRRRGGA